VHTSVGGSAPTWKTILPADVVAGSELQLHLVMTNFRNPDLTIAWEVRVEDLSSGTGQ
jgi:hypothetical protein